MTTFNLRMRSDAKHPRVAQDLRMRIVAGEYRPGDRLPLREELQHQLGASQATVQTALNVLLREGFLRTVLGQGTYVTDRPPFLTDIGLVFPLPSHTFGVHRLFTAMSVEASKAVAARSGTLRTYYNVSDPSGEEYERLLDDARCHRVAGLIWAGLSYPMHQSPIWTDPSMPPRVILQQGPNAAFDGPCVYPGTDAFLGLAVRRLKQLGRRRIAVLTCDPSPSLAEKLGRMAELAGMQCHARHVIPVSAEWSAVCRRIVPLLFAEPAGSRPDALLIADDNLVSDSTAALLATALRVPEHLSVVCLAHLPAPPKAHVPCDTLAFESADLIRICLDSIDLQRRGGVPAPLTLIEPRFVFPAQGLQTPDASPTGSI